MHLYCGIPDQEFACRVAVAIKKALPEAQIVGAASNGEICEGKLSETCVLASVFFFETSSVKIIHFRHIYSREKEAGLELLSLIDSTPDLKAVELLLPGGLDSSVLFDCLKQCRDSELPFFGGYPMGHDVSKDAAFLVTEDGCSTDTLTAILYSGKDLHVDTGRTTGWKPLGRPFKVTEASGNVLVSLDGVPAYEVYDKYLQFPENESFTEYAMEFPLIIKRGKMELLRHPKERYADNSILLDGNVREGMDICLSYGAPKRIIEKINLRCEKIRDFKPDAILLYSCHGRKSYWGDFIDWEMEPFQKIAPTAGLCSGGQIMRNFQSGRILEHRLTLVSVAFREGEADDREIPDISVDNAILKGRTSLINRMSKLVESAVGELQRTNDRLTDMNLRLQEANEELRRVAVTDALTGLYNRGEIERRIRRSLEFTRTNQKKVSLIMLDIDFFKKVNDSFGHDAGDYVLKEVSAILARNTDQNRGEAAGRWGGEEFFILLPERSLEGATQLAEAIRETVDSHAFEVVGHLTVSMGVINADALDDYQGIYTRVDGALYEAKRGGRNRVVVAADAAP